MLNKRGEICVTNRPHGGAGFHLSLLVVALTARGHEVCQAANGIEARQQVQTPAPDVVLLDWQMPVMGGEEACRSIRAVSDVPLIVVSALDRSTGASVAGAIGSLIKPVDVDVLLACVALALRHRAVKRQV